MIFNSSGDFLNSGNIADGASIAASGVQLTNTASGRIYGGVSFTAGGSTLINQLGGIIRPNDIGPITGVVITGSGGADTVDNAGLLEGSVDLAGGDDLFVQRATATGNLRIDLGAGQDIFRTDGTSSPTDLLGGLGRDRLEISSNWYQAFAVGGFEDLVISGGGWFSKLSGFSTISYGPGTTIELDQSSNPLATVAMDGGEFRLGLYSTLGGLVGGNGADTLRISRGSYFVGNVDLAGGNDMFTTAAFTVSQQAGSPFGGRLAGGAGVDTVFLGTADATPDIVEHYDVDFSALSGFEKLVFDTYVPATAHARWLADISIVGVQPSFDQITLGAYGRYSLAPAQLTGASVQIGLKSEFTIENGASINRIDNAYTGVNQVQGDDLRSVSLINAGEILGDVRFDIGDDFYDGHSGKVGGTIYGNAGNDTVIGGAGRETIVGGYGADVLTGGAGDDIFKDTAAGLNGDTITDFSRADVIVFSDATLAGFSFSLSGNILNYTGGSLTLSNASTAAMTVSAAAGGGVQLFIAPPPIVFSAGVPVAAVASEIALNSKGGTVSASAWADLDFANDHGGFDSQMAASMDHAYQPFHDIFY